MSVEPTGLSPVRESRRRAVYCFILLLAGLQIALGPKMRLSQWELSAERNAGVAEAAAWLEGRLDIPPATAEPRLDRPHDTAWFNGRVFNVFPPLIGFLTVLLSPLHRLLLGRADVWLPWPYLMLVFAPLPLLGFLVLRRQARDSAWAALLVAGWIGGTAVLPNLFFARYGHLGQINHLLAQTGLLLIVSDLLGRQRTWPALIGLAISTWSRQMTFLYAISILLVARRQGRLAPCAVGLAVVAAPLLALNWLKFGNPVDFGYTYIYAGREAEPMAQRCLEHGVLSPAFVPENAFYLFAAVPDVDFSLTQFRFNADACGASLFFTSPLYLMVFVSVRRWWADRDRRLLMLSTLPVILGLLCYHSPGFMQLGYNRFALDFVPVWLAVMAPATRGGWRTWFTLACTAWSLLYFQSIVPDVLTVVPEE